MPFVCILSFQNTSRFWKTWHVIFDDKLLWISSKVQFTVLNKFLNNKLQWTSSNVVQTWQQIWKLRNLSANISDSFEGAHLLRQVCIESNRKVQRNSPNYFCKALFNFFCKIKLVQQELLIDFETKRWIYFFERSWQ